MQTWQVGARNERMKRGGAFVSGVSSRPQRRDRIPLSCVSQHRIHCSYFRGIKRKLAECSRRENSGIIEGNSIHLRGDSGIGCGGENIGATWYETCRRKPRCKSRFYGIYTRKFRRGLHSFNGVTWEIDTRPRFVFAATIQFELLPCKLIALDNGGVKLGFLDTYVYCWPSNS